jgi:YfiH family protein
MTRPPVLTHPLLDAVPGVQHAFFSRAGGVSEGIHAGLNVGRGSRDDPAAVEENRRRAASVFGRPAGDLLTCHQIHSATAHVATVPFGPARPEGDAVVTRTPGLICGALSADCAPILLADAEVGVVGAAHAGWKGALTGVVEATIAAMEAEGADRRRIVAVVGPCIGPASYEVGLEFLGRFSADDPGSDIHFADGARADKRLFDLPGYVLARLRRSGVADAAWIGVDTCADEGFFSNRRAFQRGEPDYGRLLSAIMLV